MTDPNISRISPKAQAEASDGDGARISRRGADAAARIEYDVSRDLKLNSIAKCRQRWVTLPKRSERPGASETSGSDPRRSPPSPQRRRRQATPRREPVDIRSVEHCPSIGDERLRAEALAAIAPAQAETGDTHGANRSISEALSAARSMEDDTFLGLAALSSIATAQVQVGNYTEAIRTARSEGDRASWMLKDITEALLEAGEINGALRTARSIEDAEQRGWALHLIARVQAEAGDIAEALRTARSITKAATALRR